MLKKKNMQETYVLLNEWLLITFVIKKYFGRVCVGVMYLI